MKTKKKKENHTSVHDSALRYFLVLSFPLPIVGYSICSLFLIPDITKRWSCYYHLWLLSHRNNLVSKTMGGGAQQQQFSNSFSIQSSIFHSLIVRTSKEKVIDKYFFLSNDSTSHRFIVWSFREKAVVCIAGGIFNSPPTFILTHFLFNQRVYKKQKRKSAICFSGHVRRPWSSSKEKPERVATLFALSLFLFFLFNQGPPFSQCSGPDTEGF